MVHKSISPLIFLILCNTSLLFSVEITLFSLDYNEKGDLKIDALYNSIYNEEQIKKDAQQTEQNEQTAKEVQQELAEKERIKKGIPLKKEAIKKNIDKKRRIAKEIIFKS